MMRETRETRETRENAPVAADGPPNFIREIVAQDRAAGKHGGAVITRFPPEPNGYLHIGHAKSICLNFGLAAEFGGRCHLRFDDTNPATEEVEYVESIQEDIRWLGFDWGEHKYFASDYFEQLYKFAEDLIRAGKAYVDSSTAEQIKELRGNFYKKGVASPYRERPIDESLDLFRRMRAGEFEEGQHVLRAKIDLESGNINMRDPPIYRIKRAHHHRTGDAWCIYPMYDYAHPLSDAIESITHSICTLEFEDHRPLYDWLIENVAGLPGDPQQIEFARLNLTYTVMSKRKLLELVKTDKVSGWDDPRMPTLSGMRRLGFTPEAIRAFCERIGVSKHNGIVDVSLLEHALREHLNATSPRVMGVLRPLKLTLTDWPEDRVEWIDAPYFADEPQRGTRPVPLSRVLFIERDDFKEVPVKGWFRLSPGAEVRLRHVGIVKCVEVVKDGDEVVELRCTLDPTSRSGNPGDGRKVKGTIHWVSAQHALTAEARLYDRLFRVENPNEVAEGGHFTDHLNPNSLEVIAGCKVEPSLAGAPAGTRVQFERLAYFCVDRDSNEDRLVFNRTITLRDSWAKLEAKGG